MPAGTQLFDVYAMWGSPCDGKGCKHDKTPGDRNIDEFDLIGKIYTTDHFRTSLWGDEKLYFRHNDAKKDTKSSEGGDGTLNFGTQYLRYNFNKFGYWPDPADEAGPFTPPAATEQDVVEGIVKNDCPFQWMIDALADF